MSNVTTFVDALVEMKHNYPGILVSFMNCFWYMDGEEVLWNSDNSIEDFRDLSGNSYKAHMTEFIAETGEYTIANVDTGCGMWETIIFPNNKRISIGG